MVVQISQILKRKRSGPRASTRTAREQGTFSRGENACSWVQAVCWATLRRFVADKVLRARGCRRHVATKASWQIAAKMSRHVHTRPWEAISLRNAVWRGLCVSGIWGSAGCMWAVYGSTYNSHSCVKSDRESGCHRVAATRTWHTCLLERAPHSRATGCSPAVPRRPLPGWTPRRH